MTHHLSAEELVAVLDGVLGADRGRHLDGCEACRRAVADLESVMARVTQASDVPEPSPLFWDHLSARVQSATAAERMPEASRWPWLWRPAMAAAAAAVLLIAVVVSRPSVVPMPPTPSRSAAPAVASDAASEDASWTTMAGLAESLSADDVRLVVGTAPETLAMTDLTPKERQAFVKLLGEMGGLE